MHLDYIAYVSATYECLFAGHSGVSVVYRAVWWVVTDFCQP
jgi:hypothetical protein